MILLVIGLALLIAIHLVPAAPMVRAWCVERMGEGPYRMLFAAISILAVVLLAMGLGRAEYVPLWQAVPYGREIAPGLMAAAVLLLVAAYVPTNLRRLVDHPMLWAVTLWAVAHLLVTGHLAALLLFGGIGAYALFALLTQRYGRRWASAEPRSLAWDAATVVIAAALYLGLLVGHETLFGVAVL